MNKGKISFDFDCTLSTKPMYETAKVFIELGYEVWIVTSRIHPSTPYSWCNSSDLFTVAAELGIPREHIVFTSMHLKSEFFKDNDFLYHFDDDETEIESINKLTSTKGILIYETDLEEK